MLAAQLLRPTVARSSQAKKAKDFALSSEFVDPRHGEMEDDASSTKRRSISILSIAQTRPAWTC